MRSNVNIKEPALTLEVVLFATAQKDSQESIVKNVSETTFSKLFIRLQLLKSFKKLFVINTAIMKMKFEQATLQFQAVYVKDNHQRADCVWNDTNWLNGFTVAYHVPYQSKKKGIQIPFVSFMR